jgi:hypothetical protein
MNCQFCSITAGLHPLHGLQRHSYGVALLRHLQSSRAACFSIAAVENLISAACEYGKTYAANFDKTALGYLELRISALHVS